MTTERKLGFDPMQTMELNDGTPVALHHVDPNYPSDGYRFIVRVLEDNGDLEAGTTFYCYDSGMLNGWGQYSVQNVDPTVPEGLRKARRSYHRIPDELKPDWLDADWYAPHADVHFARLVDKDGVAMVEFHENEAKRDAERLTQMRVGRYVRRFCGGKLKDEDVERVAAASDVKLQGSRVKITQDADEIETVYENGPRSCMAGEAWDFSTGGIHPARVYAGPDLAVAYLGDATDASARAVVWPEKKVYSTTYGDCSRLRLMLEQMGYQRGNLRGARVRLIECDEGIVMPYVDGISGASVDHSENVCILGRGYDVETSNTDGLGTSSAYCECCESSCNADETTYVATGRYDGETWCDSCADSHAVYCDGYGETVAESHATRVLSGDRDDPCENYQPDWMMDDYVEIDGDYWHVDYAVEGPDGEYIHVDDAEDSEAEDSEAAPTTAKAEPVGDFRVILTKPDEPDFRVEVSFNWNAAQKTGTLAQARARRDKMARLYPEPAHVYTVEPCFLAVEIDGRFHPATLDDGTADVGGKQCVRLSWDWGKAAAWFAADGSAPYLPHRVHNLPAEALDRLAAAQPALAA